MQAGPLTPMPVVRLIATLTMHMGYTVHKPRGPVLENTISSEVAAPTYKRGFVTPKFRGLVRLYQSHIVSGEMAQTARLGARLSSCFQHLAHPLRLKTQTVAHLSRSGVKNMPAITLASRSAAPSKSKPDTIPTDRLHAVLGAFNAANLASSYIERGNFAAARRKLVLALQAVDQLRVEG